MLGIHHVGIVVADLDTATEAYRRLGFRLLETLEMPEQGVRIAAFAAGRNYLELLTPLDTESGVARFLAARGDGVHHVAYAVPNLAAALRQLDAAGYELIDREPRVGLHGWRVAFIHPRSCHGVLTELVEVAPASE
uniref:Methylmalonyl-CoA epimerase n=1 Tax=Thermorudis peleae TaxID=1382356 RepID=A0A831X6X3_9BACT